MKALHDVAVPVAVKQALDRQLIQKTGVGGTALMEVAGFQLAERIHAQAKGLPVEILCGSGNNGGDGFVIARWLHNWGHRVRCVVVLPDAHQSDENIWAQNTALASAVQIVPWSEKLEIDSDCILVDAILGSGSTRSVMGDSVLGQILQNISQRTRTKLIAIDAPTGMIYGAARIADALIMAADQTLIVGVPAPEHWIEPWKSCCGDKSVVTLGFERLLEQEEVIPVLRASEDPPLKALQKHHKAETERIVIVGGAAGMSGAAMLVARGAFRSGAGLVYTTGNAGRGEENLPELMHCCDKPTDFYDWMTSQPWSGSAVLVLGPGLGRDDAARAWVSESLRFVADHSEVRIVIDADALHLISGAQLVKYAGRCIVTPHPGEAAALLGISTPEVQNHRLDACMRLAKGTEAAVLLKGSDPILQNGAANPQQLCLFTGSAPALGTGGSGDVLSGIVAGLLARKGNQSCSTWNALVYGTWLHQKAGLHLGQSGSSGWLASEIADAVQQVWQ